MIDQPIWYGDIDNIRKLFNVTYENGIKFERERIINLLQSYFKPEEAKALYPADYEQYLDLIELIKGENK
jgi:hypothetical protein